MNAIGLSLLTSIVLAAPPAAPEPSTDAQAKLAATSDEVRAAVQRSLPYIEKIGVEWINSRKCNSCHTVTFLVWSHNAAAAHGLDVDRKKLAEWTRWSLDDSLADNYWFKIRPRAVEGLKSAGLPDTVLAKLKPLVNKTHTTKDNYVEALKKALGDDDWTRYEKELIQHAAQPNNGGGPDTLYQHLLARTAAKPEPSTAESYDAVRALLLEWQEPGGGWETQGQLPELKWRDANEMNDATTLWCMLALATDADSQITREPIERALASIRSSTPGKTVQSLLLHLLVAHRFGEPQRAAALREKLFAAQKADGGWSWVPENEMSDAFATGQVLYALGSLGLDGRDKVVGRAWQYLLNTQSADGGWQVPQEAINKRPRKLNVYPFWGTAWAAIGLLETLPDDER